MLCTQAVSNDVCGLNTVYLSAVLHALQNGWLAIPPLQTVSSAVMSAVASILGLSLQAPSCRVASKTSSILVFFCGTVA